MPRYDAAREAIEVLDREAPPESLDIQTEAVIATAMGVQSYWSAPVRTRTIDTLIRYWALRGDSAFVVDVVVATLSWSRNRSRGSSRRITVRWNIEGNQRAELSETVPGPFEAMRRWLATTSAR